jgi:alpha-methylacyl-CoA racemase
MLLLVGVLAALVERGVSGRGQVVDAAMVDGATSLLALTYGLLGAGLWRLERGANLLDGGAPYYATYRCSDSRHVAVAALEERFWAELVRVLGLDLTGVGPREDPATWPALRARLEAAFAARPRDAWAELFAPLDACVAPVLTLAETLAHPQLGGRGAVLPSPSGAPEPGPAPRFSRTPASVGPPPRPAGADTLAALLDWGLPESRARELLAAGVAVQT